MGADILTSLKRLAEAAQTTWMEKHHLLLTKEMMVVLDLVGNFDEASKNKAN